MAVLESACCDGQCTNFWFLSYRTFGVLSVVTPNAIRVLGGRAEVPVKKVF